jgi:nucleoid-associated protein YgaU
MGMFDFLKDAGEELTQQQSDTEAAVEQAKGAALAYKIGTLGLQVEGLEVGYDDGIVTVKGNVPSQQEREKVVLALGNTQGVARVDDQLVVAVSEPEAILYTVQAGDNLSKIAKAHYGDGNKYQEIFAANRPLLENPDKIYPGQVIRIPPLKA